MSKAQEATEATASPSQSDERRYEAEYDGDNPHVDNAEAGNGYAGEGNDDAEASGDDDTEAEESDDKQSAAEKSG
ncbi:hypothetical protein HAX54_008333, partial [Datura stramonium]|nr:hypothetical protein [Datura stramonium]